MKNRTFALTAVLGLCLAGWVTGLVRANAGAPGPANEYREQSQPERSSQSPGELSPAPGGGQNKITVGRELSPEREEFRRRFAAQVFQMLDTNRDSALGLEEFHQIGPKRIFRRMDVDRDGKLTQAEWTEQRAGAGMAAQQLRRYRPFFRADRDGDGRVARNEMMRGNFDESDLDRDGYLSLGEWKGTEARQRNHLVSEFIQKHDRNGDGKVTRTEFGGRAEEFDRIDTDMDAEITSADITRVSQ